MQLHASEKAKYDRRKSIRLLENLKVKSVLIEERFKSGKKKKTTIVQGLWYWLLEGAYD